MIEEAIQIFKLEVDVYPKFWNAYDSLADAYRTSGNRELAIANYKRSLELNPRNKNATTQLKTLEAGHL